jgi:pre-mRNA-splicing factor CWC22
VNQYVIGSLIPLQILALLLDKPTDDGIEVAVNFIKECGQRLSKMSPKPFNGIFSVFRSILHEGTLDKRVQYMIEHLFIIRKSKYAPFDSYSMWFNLADGLVSPNMKPSWNLSI